jgi:hypothetical protein
MDFAGARCADLHFHFQDSTLVEERQMIKFFGACKP